MAVSENVKSFAPKQVLVGLEVPGRLNQKSETHGQQINQPGHFRNLGSLKAKSGLSHVTALGLRKP